MFEECVLELWLEIATRGRLMNLLSEYLNIPYVRVQTEKVQRKILSFHLKTNTFE